MPYRDSQKSPSQHIHPERIQDLVHGVDVKALLDAVLHGKVVFVCGRDAVARAREEIPRVVEAQPQDEDECVDDANFRMIVLVGTDLGEQFAVNPRTLVHLYIGHAALVDEAQEPLGEGFFRLVEFAPQTRENAVQTTTRTGNLDAQ